MFSRGLEVPDMTMRILPIAAVLAVFGCAKPVVPPEAKAKACPQRVVTWMVCPTPSGVSTGCRVWGEELGCGLDALAIDYANQRMARGDDYTGRFTAFVVAVTPQGVGPAEEVEAQDRPRSWPLD